MNHHNENSFTMNKLLVFVSVIVILLAVCVPIFSDIKERAYDMIDEKNIELVYEELSAALVNNADEENYGLSNELWMTDDSNDVKTVTRLFEGKGQKEGWSNFGSIYLSPKIDGIVITNKAKANRVVFTINSNKITGIAMTKE